ncbi:MAG: PKD domain-containing protein, partial [Promethearchaeota archaeon]
MSSNKNLHFRRLLSIILIVMIAIPLGVSLNQPYSNSENSSLSTSDYTLTDYVDNIYRITHGSITNFFYMTQDNEGFATLFEGFQGGRFLIDQTFMFTNVNPSFDTVELHFDIRGPFRGRLDVLVGQTPVSFTKVGEINHVGDNFFDVKPYLRGGIFYVRLTDSNYPGNLGAYFIQRMYLLMTILNVNPSVNAGLDQHAFEGEVVQFSGSFTDPNIIDTHTIEWDFGDGTGRSNTLTPSHLYHDDGVYTVLLTVTDSEGGVGTDTLIVTVSNIIPIVSAMEDQNTQEGSENSLILATFTDQGEFDSHSALIDWGDGTIEPGIVIEPIDNEYWEGIGTVNGPHTYKDNGIYVVTIIVSDDDGDTNSDSLLFTVDNIAPIVGAGS